MQLAPTKVILRMHLQYVTDVPEFPGGVGDFWITTPPIHPKAAQKQIEERSQALHGVSLLAYELYTLSSMKVLNAYD